MDIESLVKEQEETCKLLRAAKDKLYSTLKSTLESVIDLDIAEVTRVSDEHAEILVKPGERRLTIDIYYHKPWRDEKRMVQMNTCSFGSFDCTEQECINYAIVAGMVASHLKELQEKFETADFAEHDSLQSQFYTIRAEIDKINADIKKAELEKKAAEIKLKLIVGAKINRGSSWGIAEITKSTPKRVEFSDWMRKSKDEVVSYFLASRNPWTFA